MVKRCVANGCNVRAKQNFMLFRFPKEPTRRANWISFVNRLNWQPSADSTLCELHFNKDQWEQQRVDGSRKLKCSAIPSLQCSTENSSLAPYIHWNNEHNYCYPFNPPAENIRTSKISEPETTEASKILETSEIQLLNTPVRYHSTGDESIDALKKQLLLKEKELSALQSKYHSLQKMTSLTSKRYCSVKKRYKLMVNKLKRLQELHYHNQEFGTRLREDQRIVLCLKTAKGRKWSTATITDGLMYKMKWGTQGYLDFVKRFPIFPSIRTLQRAIKLST